MKRILFDITSPFGTWNPQGLAAISLNCLQKLPRWALFRRLAFLLRKPIKSGRQQLYDREIWGLRLRLSTQGNLTEQRWLTMEQFHDWPERRFLREFLQDRSVFLDVGANAGFYTMWVLSRCRDSMAIAVEPVETLVERFRFNLKLNSMQNRVQIFCCAATPQICEVSIVEGSANLGQTSVKAQGVGERVPGRPLLDIIREAGVPRVDAMKIDIEGNEVGVLSSFFAEAPRALWPRLVIAEIFNESSGALQNLLAQNQYVLKCATKMNGIFCRNPE